MTARERVLFELQVEVQQARHIANFHNRPSEEVKHWEEVAAIYQSALTWLRAEGDTSQLPKVMKCE